MNVISVLTSKKLNFKSKSTSNDAVTVTVPKQALKGAAMLAASMLSLAALGKASIDINNISQNEAAKSGYVHKDVNNVKSPFKQRKNTGSKLSDEEILHRLAIGLSLIGFFSPLIMNIFSKHEDTTNYE